MRASFYVVGCAGLLISCFFFATDQFVIKKKKKKISVATLKEQCCQSCGDVLRFFPKILKEIAEIQSLELDAVYDLLEGSKDFFFAHANKEQLQELLTAVQVFEQKMHTMHTIAHEHKKYLQKVLVKGKVA